MPTIKLTQLSNRLTDLDYPIDRADAERALEDVTLQLADGEASLGGILAAIDDPAFDTPTELEESIQNALPIEAVGEPGQSEGEG